jgi:Putative restriction endonuclease
VRDWRTLDLAVDPPPDLAIEIDITSSVLNRMDVYAALRIPELWRFDGQALEVYHLSTDGVYASTAKSIALPLLPLDKLLPLLEQGVSRSSDAEWLREIQIWLREHVLSRRPEVEPSTSPPG